MNGPVSIEAAGEIVAVETVLTEQSFRDIAAQSDLAEDDVTLIAIQFGKV